MSKTLDRISLLLNQAENTTNEAEANAFMEKAQALATAASIELEVARQHQADKTKREVPIQKRITVAQTVGGYSTKDGYSTYTRPRVQNNAAEMVQLFLTIGGQNAVKCNIAHDSSWVIAFGFPSDIEVCEALFASLLVQMKAACDAEIKKGDYKNEGKTYDWVTGRMVKPDARRFRTSFYQAFTSRIGARLRAARREAEAVTVTVEQDGAQVETTGALVLVPKAVEVSDFYDRESRARGSWKGGNRQSVGSSTGSAAGSAAGDRARLGGERSIGGSKGSIAC